jgi:exonuclease SbcC
VIRRLILENFMAHGRTELVLGPGLTALTGPNNVGKSAVVEALRCLAQNPAPRHVIRHGAKEARVTLELDDGCRVVWIRKKASAGYELWRPGAEAPEEFWKLGRGGVPDEIRDALRLDLVELEGRDPVDVHLGDQREPVFLLNLPPAAAAGFFAASSESAHLLAMQDLLKRRMADAKRDQAQARDRLAAAAADLGRLAGLPDLHLALESARDQEAAVKQAEARIPALERLLERRAALDRALARSRDRSAVLAPLAAPAEPAPTAQLASILKNIQNLRSSQERTQARAAVLAPLAPLPEVRPATPVADYLASRKNLELKLKAVKKAAEALAGLQACPKLSPSAPLAGLLERVRAARAGLDAARKSGEACAARLHKLKERIAARLAEVGVCPTCKAGLELSRFLQEAS